ncbi:MAG: hypothetical protein QXL18_04675 [Candidatus Woesearchaeota archaeon]
MRIFIGIFIIILSSSFVSANIGDKIIEIVNYEIPAPAYVVDSSSGYSGLPFWVVVLTFMLLFSIIWLASMQVPLFKEQKNQGPRKAFVIALALLTIFTTPVVKWILKMIKLFTVLTIIALLIAGIYTIYVLTRSNIAKNRKTDSESSKVIADAKSIEAAAERQNAQTKNYKEKTQHATKHGLKHQLAMIRQIEDHMNHVISTLNHISPRLRNANDTISPSEVSRIMRHLNNISIDLGKLLTYKSNNDRLLTGMSTRNYYEDNTPNTLINVHPGSGPEDYAGRRVHIAQNIDTQTNDLGSAINGMISIIRYDGIRGSNINKLTEMSLNALNIIQRIKRDIVLEQQMIEKI